MSALRYSKKQPTEPGWFWCRTREPWEAVVRVERRNGKLFCIWLLSPEECMMLSETDWNKETLWAGPLVPPKGAK